MTPQCLCETCMMTVEQCRGQQLRQGYQSERDKVLDELINWCKEEAKTYSQYYLTESGYDILATFEQKLTVLRQAGEQK